MPLLPDDFDQHPFPPPAVKLTVKDLLPGAKVEAAAGDGNDHLTAHDLPLQVRIGIPVTLIRTGVLAGAVVLVLADGCVRFQLFEPHLVIVVQATLVIVDKYTGRNVLRIYKGQRLPCGIPLSYPCRSRPWRP